MNAYNVCVCMQFRITCWCVFVCMYMTLWDYGVMPATCSKLTGCQVDVRYADSALG
jgi:hypothetical protein